VGEKASAAQADVLEAVLGDRVAGVAALGQPAHHLGRALADRMKVAGRDHQQRDAVHAMVAEPVTDHRTALEGRGLDPVQRDGDRARAPDRGASRNLAHGPSAHAGRRGRAMELVAHAALLARSVAAPSSARV
jgi:hypothetical protein